MQTRRDKINRAVNGVLSRTIGYKLTKAKSPAQVRAEQERARAAKEQAARERAAAAQAAKEKAAKAKAERQKAAKEKAEREKAAREFPVDYDEDFRQIIRAVRPYTMTSNDKLHALISATKYIQQHQVPGAIVECGVWRGGSMHAVARTLDAAGDHERELFLFDTFEGMTEPTEKDTRHDGQTAGHLMATQERERSAVWAYASLEDVKQGFEQVPYPGERVHYVQGPVEQTVPGEAPEQIALLRLDTDWYESTKHEFDHLYSRLVSGGVLMIDDYGWWQGSRTATEEFLSESGAQLLLLRMASGRVAVKP